MLYVYNSGGIESFKAKYGVFGYLLSRWCIQFYPHVIPRRRGIQYAAASPHHGTAAAYWITRFRW
ncbi:hypothetical protein CDS [Bradyrhizobium sp. G22]|nr:hypothetical protein CDS [Bradyrhizobium sp. G22]